MVRRWGVFCFTLLLESGDGFFNVFSLNCVGYAGFSVFFVLGSFVPGYFFSSRRTVSFLSFPADRGRGSFFLRFFSAVSFIGFRWIGVLRALFTGPSQTLFPTLCCSNPPLFTLFFEPLFFLRFLGRHLFFRWTRQPAPSALVKTGP